MRGGQRQALLLMRCLRDSGHSTELLAHLGSALWKEARSLDFAVRPVGLGTLWVRSRNADLVHAHDARAHTFAAIASRRPFVVSRRVAFGVKLNPLSRRKYRRARRFLAVSQFVAKQLELAGIASNKIDVVYDGVDTGASHKRDGAANPLIVTLKSDDPLKGRDLVEQAAHIAGVPVLFSQDLSNDLRRASLFVYITRSEGLGSAALLAMSFSVPVVASRVGGLPEIVIHGETGLVVGNKAEEIAAAMLQVNRNPELGRKLGQNGRRLVEQQFTLKKMVEGTLASYRRALA